MCIWAFNCKKEKWIILCHVAAGIQHLVCWHSKGGSEMSLVLQIVEFSNICWRSAYISRGECICGHVCVVDSERMPLTLSPDRNAHPHTPTLPLMHVGVTDTHTPTLTPVHVGVTATHTPALPHAHVGVWVSLRRCTCT